MNKLIERRLEFLKLEGMGFSLCEIVKALSKKYHKSERMIYYDAETRGTWQPVLTQLFELNKAQLIVINRYETIYREAAFIVKLSDKRNKPSALRIMLDTTKALTDLLGISSVAQEQVHQERMRLVEDQIDFLNQIREKVTA